MREIVAKISEFSYDIVAFMLPGFATFLVISGGITIIGLTHSTLEQLRTANEALDWFEHNVWAAAIGVISFSYLFAILTQHIASQGAWKVRANGFAFPRRPIMQRLAWLRGRRRTLNILRWFSKSGRDASLRVFFLRRLFARPRTYAPELEATFNATALKLATSVGYLVDQKKLWLQYFPLARTLARRDTHPSLVQSYQNKYTLARSMAYVVSISFWMTAITLTFTLSESSLSVLFIAAAFLCAFVLIRALVSQYEYHWTNWGGIVIAETALILSDVEKAPKPLAEGRSQGSEEKE